jgi:tetratricopeptide (TPR) repeat protein
MSDDLNNLLTSAVLAHEKKDYENALLNYEKVLAINPNLPQVYIKVGNLCLELSALNDALFYYEKALTLEPKNFVAYANIASVFKTNNQLQEAQEFYEKALEINPNYVIALYNLSHIYLLKKEYHKGFDYYRFRYKQEIRGNKAGGIAYLPTLLKKGDDISGKVLYASHEQGIGDTIQTVRFLPFFQEKAQKILCYAPPSLSKLFTYNYPKIEFLPPNSNITFDYNFPMFEAPYLLDTTYENIPFNEKYLSVKQEDSQEFKSKYINNNDKIKICINYKGSLSSNASIELPILLEALTTLNKNRYEIYSLQYERTPEENKLLQENHIVNLGQYITDFYDTALIIDNMDILVSIDTSVLHLAGAMGKRSFALLKFTPDWRWGLEETTTNWYKSIEIFRQESFNNWGSILTQLLSKIESHAR